MIEQDQSAPAGVNISELEVSAGDTAMSFLESAEHSIDLQFGAGHAARHPAIVAGFLQASALVYLAERIAERMEGRNHG
jgi:hypothetical protein